jgi:hypothetical protein
MNGLSEEGRHSIEGISADLCQIILALLILNPYGEHIAINRAWLGS